MCTLFWSCWWNCLIYGYLDFSTWFCFVHVIFLDSVQQTKKYSIGKVWNRFLICIQLVNLAVLCMTGMCWQNINGLRQEERKGKNSKFDIYQNKEKIFWSLSFSCSLWFLLSYNILCTAFERENVWWWLTVNIKYRE